MRVGLKIDGDLAAIMRRELAAGETAVTRAIGAAGQGLKSGWRGQVAAAGLGTRLARTIRADRFPNQGRSLAAAALVYTRAPEILGAFDEGATIRSRDGFWLAIPTEEAGRTGLGGKKITPGGFERRTGLRLRFVYRRGKPSLLVTDGARLSSRGLIARKGGKRRKDGTLKGEQTVVAFILVPKVRLSKSLIQNYPRNFMVLREGV